MILKCKQNLACLIGLLFGWIDLAFAQTGDTTSGPDWLTRLQQGVTAQDWQQILNNMAQSFPDIEKLISGVAYIIGIVFAIRALYYLKIYGELRTMMSSNSSLRPPLTYLLIAGVFLFMPVTMDTMMTTVFTTPEIQPLSYVSETASPQYGLGLKAILAFIQLIGYIAFVRGWLIIAHTSQQGGRETVGKGLTHIIGGVLAINIVGTRDVIWNTLGFQ